MKPLLIFILCISPIVASANTPSVAPEAFAAETTDDGGISYKMPTVTVDGEQAYIRDVFSSPRNVNPPYGYCALRGQTLFLRPKLGYVSTYGGNGSTLVGMYWDRVGTLRNIRKIVTLDYYGNILQKEDYNLDEDMAPSPGRGQIAIEINCKK